MTEPVQRIDALRRRFRHTHLLCTVHGRLQRLLAILAMCLPVLSCGDGEDTALKELQETAEQGNAEVQALLGRTYYAGKGVEKNYMEAAKWFHKAAEQGNAEAQASLCRMYYKGEGVVQDFVTAGKWCHKAAEQGNAEAQFVFGVMYIKGEGVKKDFVAAHMLFNLAAAQGNEKAREARDIVAKEMTDSQIVEAQRWAREWKKAQDGSK